MKGSKDLMYPPNLIDKFQEVLDRFFAEMTENFTHWLLVLLEYNEQCVMITYNVFLTEKKTSHLSWISGVFLGNNLLNENLLPSSF